MLKQQAKWHFFHHLSKFCCQWMLIRPLYSLLGGNVSCSSPPSCSDVVFIICYLRSLGSSGCSRAPPRGTAKLASNLLSPLLNVCLSSTKVGQAIDLSIQWTISLTRWSTDWWSAISVSWSNFQPSIDQSVITSCSKIWSLADLLIRLTFLNQLINRAD